MNYKKLYPLTIPLVEDHPRLISEIFREVRPHKEGSFVGVMLLQGSYYAENGKELFDSLIIGERLKVAAIGKASIYSNPIIVSRNDGTELGYIPKTSESLLNMLLERGIGVFAYCEAKSYTSDVLKIAVSVYCDKY